MFIYGLLLFFLVIIWDVNLVLIAVYLANSDYKILKEKYGYKNVPWALILFNILSLIGIVFIIIAIVNS